MTEPAAGGGLRRVDPAAAGGGLYRDFDLGLGAARLSRLALLYGGGFVALHALGLAVRGVRGWLLVLAPLLIMVAGRLWAWRRVSVELLDGRLRYEGADPARDFEVPLAEVVACYRDGALPGAPLVLVLEGGDERVLADLAPAALEALRARLEGGAPRAPS